MYDGLPSVEGMDARYQNPFAAFWNQGLVPGQGFPQVGMSAYGYGLPGFGLRRFLNPDALILAGAGEGEINEHDLSHMDDQVYGYNRFKDNENQDESRPDPAYPGCFKGEECNDNQAIDDDGSDDGSRHHYHHYHNAGRSALDCLHGRLMVTAAILGALAA
ncbi:hypothetical protein IWW55_004679 [Coemansia sp. RSA 2706]|nr:hypothetical protein LPJ63_000640 [Coemansia sp. RSA 2711]KAJ2297775.1 hypothetical protein IWW55_004679 [Coemansia sp. RSA 2706]KAJ2304330.1 hypothetical protein IWW54_005439 [Coemansia sp. RSA 2705]KAJ2311196.1 hypothetical protein IWW52_005198 [Coemansia sp. RSA 2704]KAJ2385951.1 hypothetical protein H4S02_004079 [Coemansia sp. RSA 2611]